MSTQPYTAVAAAVTLTATACMGAFLLLSPNPQPPPAPAPAAPAVVAEQEPQGPQLNGIYIVEHHYEAATGSTPAFLAAYAEAFNGEADSAWEYTSNCAGTRCTATGTQLNGPDDLTPHPDSPAVVMRYQDGAWRTVSPRVMQPRCAQGEASHAETIWFAPTSGGELRGEVVADFKPGDCPVAEGAGGVTVPITMTSLRTGRDV